MNLKKVVMKNKWREKTLWVSITSVIIMLLGNLGLFDTIGITQDEVKTSIDIVLSALSTWGIIVSHDVKEIK